MKKYVLACLLLLGVWNIPVQAATAKLSFTTKITLPASGPTISVEHAIRVDSPGEIKLELPVRGVKEVHLKSSGGSVNLTTNIAETESLYQGEYLKTTTFSFSAPGNTNLTLSYRADGPMRTLGSSSAFAWSTYTSGGTQHEVSITIPGILGRPSIVGQPSANSSFEDGAQTYHFDTTRSEKPVKLFFGATASWQLNWSTTLKNGSWWWQKHRVVLPPDTNQQRVWLESVSPQPNRLSVDRDGNLIAEYRLWPKKSLTITAAAYTSSRTLFYNTSNTRPLADVPAELHDYTTRTGDNIAQDTQVLAQVKKFYQQAVESAREREGDPERITSDGQKIVVELLENLRRSGIPTREISGVTFASREQLLDNYTSAAWVEAYAPGIGWMTVDPLGEQFGFGDALRIGLVIFGAPSSIPLAAQLDGLTIEIRQEAALPEPDFAPSHVSMTRFMLVPGLSLNRVKVGMPKGIVLDNAAAVAHGTNVAFGSLAPLQQASRWSASLGSESFNQGEIQFGRGGEAGLGEVLSTGPVGRNYLLIVFEVVLITGAGWLLLRARKRRKQSNRIPPLEKQFADDTIATDDLLRARNQNYPDNHAQ